VLLKLKEKGKSKTKKYFPKLSTGQLPNIYIKAINEQLSTELIYGSRNQIQADIYNVKI
jgi:hypothetical protein